MHVPCSQRLRSPSFCHLQAGEPGSWWPNSIQVWRPENQELQWPRVGEGGHPRSTNENLPFLWFLFSLGLWRSGWWLLRSLLHPQPLGPREAIGEPRATHHARWTFFYPQTSPSSGRCFHLQREVGGPVFENPVAITKSEKFGYKRLDLPGSNTVGRVVGGNQAYVTW